MGRTVIVAQARMSSTRMPGKSLANLGGMPVIDHVLQRAARAELADDVIVATTTHSSDDVLVEHLEAIGVAFVRGSLDDVLSRYVLAAQAAGAETIVRLTCDCPLIDPAVIDRVIAAFCERPQVDYCSNTLIRSYPIGMDAEAFSCAALGIAASDAKNQLEREHVTPYLYQHPELFRLRSVEAPDWARRPQLRLTLDEPADLEMLQALLGVVDWDASIEEILGALAVHPEIERLNAAVPHRHTAKPASW